MAAGLSVGLSGLAAGYAIGIVGDAVRRTWHNKDARAELTLAGCTLFYATVTDLRRHGSHSHFRWSLGSLWVRTPLLPTVHDWVHNQARHVFDMKETTFVWLYMLIITSLIVALILNTRASGW
jgi:hypothetical protein